MRQRLTGQDRDNETSLDYFHARYFSGGQGRFTSVDPANAGAALHDPQSWNGYAYVSNNPMMYTDPSGLGFWSFMFNASLKLGDMLTRFASFGGMGLPGYGGTNDGPWNERPPISGGSGGVNTGGVFGSGSTDQFIFSLTPGDLKRVPSLGAQNIMLTVIGWGQAFGILGDLLSGSGSRRRVYTMSNLETHDLMRSGGFKQVTDDISRACRRGLIEGSVDLGTFGAAKNLPRDMVLSPTGAQVGGYTYLGRWKIDGGNVDINISNDAGAESLFYHRVPNAPWSQGPMSTINQTFKISMPNPCAR